MTIKEALRYLKEGKTICLKNGPFYVDGSPIFTYTHLRISPKYGDMLIVNESDIWGNQCGYRLALEISKLLSSDWEVVDEA